MQVFVSWSGDLSRKVAELLSTWIQDTLQGVKAWISSEDIDKGTLWFSEITNTLSETNFGIICLTSDNLNNPWILFEAGALSKGLSKNKVCPFLINLNISHLVPPLSQLNAVLPSKGDLLKLLKSINNEQSNAKLSEERLEKTFERWWGAFDTDFKKLLTEFKPIKKPQQKTTDEMLEEILESTRSIQRSVQSPIPEEVLKAYYEREINRKGKSFKDLVNEEKLKLNFTEDEVKRITELGKFIKSAMNEKKAKENRDFDLEEFIKNSATP